MYIIAGSCLKRSVRSIIQPQQSEHLKIPQDFPAAFVCFAWVKQTPGESYAFLLSFKYIKLDKEARFFLLKLIRYNPQGNSLKSTDLSASFIASFIPLKVISIIFSLTELGMFVNVNFMNHTS